MRAVHEADVIHGTTPFHVEAVLAQRPGAGGAARLRSIVDGDAGVTLSKLERRFVQLMRENGLPVPRTRIVASGRRVDCRWPGHRLTAELDSYRYHRTRYAFENDRRREREARARGDDFRRFTYGDVMEDPGPVVRELTAFFVGHPIWMGHHPTSMGRLQR